MIRSDKPFDKKAHFKLMKLGFKSDDSNSRGLYFHSDFMINDMRIIFDFSALDLSRVEEFAVKMAYKAGIKIGIIKQQRTTFEAMNIPVTIDQKQLVILITP